MILCTLHILYSKYVDIMCDCCEMGEHRDGLVVNLELLIYTLYICSVAETFIKLITMAFCCVTGMMQQPCKGSQTNCISIFLALSSLRSQSVC